MSTCEFRTPSNKELVLRHIELLNADRIEDAHTLVADDATFWFAGGLSGIGLMNKAERIARLKEWLKIMATPVRYQVISLTAEEDRIAVEATNQAMAHDGRHYDQCYFILFRVSEGLIRTMRIYFDTDLARRILTGAAVQKVQNMS